MATDNKHDQQAIHDSIDRLRHDIDNIDLAMLRLIEQREEAVIAIGRLKRCLSARPEYFVPSREKEILDRVCAEYKGSFKMSVVKIIYKLIIKSSRQLQKIQT